MEDQNTVELEIEQTEDPGSVIRSPKRARRTLFLAIVAAFVIGLLFGLRLMIRANGSAREALIKRLIDEN